jgi:hypothetical protein
MRVMKFTVTLWAFLWNWYIDIWALGKQQFCTVKILCPHSDVQGSFAIFVRTIDVDYKGKNRSDKFSIPL